MTELTAPSRLQGLIPLVCNTLPSEHSRRAYTRALRDFLAFAEAQKQPFSRPLVQAWVASLHAMGRSPSTVNQALSAVKTLAKEAGRSGWLDYATEGGIRDVEGMPRRGTRLGHWLSIEQARKLLAAPDRNTTKGRRDYILLALMIGTGARRGELATLTLDHLQQREGVWLLADIWGKGMRMRSLPLPAWLWTPMLAWAAEVKGNGRQYLIPQLDYKGTIMGEKAISEQRMFALATEYSLDCGLGHTAPHDLRRTFAKLAREGGCPIEQIQAMLGHQSIATTELYLGGSLDIQKSAASYVRL